VSQEPRHFSRFSILPQARGVVIKPIFLYLVSTNLFSEIDHEDPYAYLDKIYELCTTMEFNVG